MPSPFPGMDPYLENVELWSGFHAPFLVAMLDRLSPLIRPNYFARVEERVYLSDELDPGRRLVPDVRVIAVPPVVAARPPRPDRGQGGTLTIAEPIPVIEHLDEEVHEYRLEVRDRVDRSVVTVIELLSATNKTPGAGPPELPAEAAGGVCHVGALDRDRPTPRRRANGHPRAGGRLAVPGLLVPSARRWAARRVDVADRPVRPPARDSRAAPR